MNDLTQREEDEYVRGFKAGIESQALTLATLRADRDGLRAAILNLRSAVEAKERWWTDGAAPFEDRDVYYEAVESALDALLALVDPSWETP